jgi:hypothetical protein
LGWETTVKNYERIHRALVAYVEAHADVFKVYVTLLDQLAEAETELREEALKLPWDEEHELVPGLIRKRSRPRTKYDPGRLTREELLIPGIVSTLDTTTVRRELSEQRAKQLAVVTQDKPSFIIPPFSPKDFLP